MRPAGATSCGCVLPRLLCSMGTCMRLLRRICMAPKLCPSCPTGTTKLCFKAFLGNGARKRGSHISASRLKDLWTQSRSLPCLTCLALPSSSARPGLAVLAAVPAR
eukprot:14595426-Alexandrium_andersonii.AAC.1